MKVVEDLDYADDTGLLSFTHQDSQQKIERHSKSVIAIGLKFNTEMTQVLRKNTRVIDTVMIGGKHLEDVEKFAYSGTKVTTTGDCDQEINTRINFRHAETCMESHQPQYSHQD